MATPSDLCGLGVAPELAQRLGNAPVAVTAAGTTQATATTLQGGRIYNVTTGGSTTGVILNSNMANGSWIAVNVTSATSGVVYAPGSATINGTAGATGITVAQNKTLMVWRYSSTLFFSVLTA